MESLLDQATRIASIVTATAQQQQQQPRSTGNRFTSTSVPTFLDFTADIDVALSNSEAAFESFNTDERRKKRESEERSSNKDDNSTSSAAPQHPNLDHYLVNANSAACTLLSRVQRAQSPYLEELRSLLLRGILPQTRGNSNSNSGKTSRSRSPVARNPEPEDSSSSSSRLFLSGIGDIQNYTDEAQGDDASTSVAEYEKELREIKRQRDEHARALEEQKREEQRAQAAAEAERERVRREQLVIQRREQREREQRWQEVRRRQEAQDESQRKRAQEAATRILRNQQQSFPSIREIFSSNKKRTNNSSSFGSRDPSVGSIRESGSMSSSSSHQSHFSHTEIHLRRLVWRRVCELDHILQVSNQHHPSLNLSVGIASPFLRQQQQQHRPLSEEEQEECMMDDDQNVLLLGTTAIDEDGDGLFSSSSAAALRYLSCTAVEEEVVDLVVSLVLDAAVALTAIQLLVYTKDFIFGGQQQQDDEYDDDDDDDDFARAIPPLLFAAEDGTDVEGDDGPCSLSEVDRHQNWRKVLHFARDALTAENNINNNSNAAGRGGSSKKQHPPFTNVINALAAVEEGASVFSHVELGSEQREQLILKRACEFLRCVNDLLRKLVPLTVIRNAERSRLHAEHEMRRKQQQQQQQHISHHLLRDGSQDSLSFQEDLNQQQQQQNLPIFLQRSDSFQKSSAATRRSLAAIPASTWTKLDRSLCAWVNSLGVLPHLAVRNNNISSNNNNVSSTSSGYGADTSQPSLRLPFETLLDPPIAVRAAYVSPFACCASADHCAHVSHNCDAVYKQHYHHQEQKVSSSSRENSVVAASGRAASAESVHSQQHQSSGNISFVNASSSSSFIEQHRSLKDPDIFPFLTNGTVFVNIINVGLGTLNGVSSSSSSSSSSKASRSRAAAAAVAVAFPLLKVYDNPRTIAHCRANVEAALHFLSHTQRLSSSKFGQEILVPLNNNSNSSGGGGGGGADAILKGDFASIIAVLEALRVWWNSVTQQQASGVSGVAAAAAAAAVFSEARRVLNQVLGGSSSMRSGADVESRRNFDWVRNLLSSRPAHHQLRPPAPAMSAGGGGIFVDPLSLGALQQQRKRGAQNDDDDHHGDGGDQDRSAPSSRSIPRGGFVNRRRSSSMDGVSFLSPVAVVVNSPNAVPPAASGNFALSQAAMGASAVNAQLSFMQQ